MASKMTSRKRPKSYYTNRPRKKRARGRAELSVGMQGILITTNDKEKLCVSEAYNLLNEYADELYGPEFSVGENSSFSDEDSSEGVVSDEEVEDTIAKEMKALKGKPEEKQERRFQSVQSRVKNIVFIKCQAPVDPRQLVHRVLSDIKETGVQKTRFCQRMIPVTKVCRANMKDIQRQLDSVLQPHFHNSTDPVPLEFAVHYKCRNNHSLQRDKVIQMVASLVTDDGAYPHIVNLKKPELVVCIEIVKNMCCMAVVNDFSILRQYNIQMISEDAVKDKETSSCPETTTKSCSQSELAAPVQIACQSREQVQPASCTGAQDLGHNPNGTHPHSCSSPQPSDVHQHPHSSDTNPDSHCTDAYQIPIPASQPTTHSHSQSPTQ